jgi:hypothetical protein
MQFRILPVAVALLGMYMVVVLAADPCVKADVQHAKCYGYDHRRHWIAENEEVDAEAMKTVGRRGQGEGRGEKDVLSDRMAVAAVASPTGHAMAASPRQELSGIVQKLYGASSGPSQPAISRQRLNHHLIS